MKISLEGLKLIRKFEACRLEAYLDSVKVPTIGWGNTFYENGTKVKLGDKITQERADSLNQITADRFAERISSFLIVAITQNKFDALVSFAYNVGLANFQSSTLLKKVNKNPEDPEIRTEFEKWNKAGGKVLNGLTVRRQQEADYYFK